MGAKGGLIKEPNLLLNDRQAGKPRESIW